MIFFLGILKKQKVMGTNQTFKSWLNPKVWFFLSEGIVAVNGPWWKEGRKMFGTLLYDPVPLIEHVKIYMYTHRT